MVRQTSEPDGREEEMREDQDDVALENLLRSTLFTPEGLRNGLAGILERGHRFVGSPSIPTLDEDAFNRAKKMATAMVDALLANDDKYSSQTVFQAISSVIAAVCFASLDPRQLKVFAGQLQGTAEGMLMMALVQTVQKTMDTLMDPNPKPKPRVN